MVLLTDGAPNGKCADALCHAPHTLSPCLQTNGIFTKVGPWLPHLRYPTTHPTSPLLLEVPSQVPLSVRAEDRKLQPQRAERVVEEKV